MKLTIGKKANVNYLAKIVRINQFKPHTDPEVTRLKACVVDGFNILCGIDSEPGLYVYFPTACCLNPDFLRYANLYKHKELNADPEQSGMFEDNGRVKAIRLRGELSEGFILPVTILENYVLSVTNVELTCEEGIEFDIVEHDDKTFWINKKYIPKNTRTPGAPGSKSGKGKQPKGIDKILENQFRFHYDTTLIKKCPHVIKSNDLISITEKVHGTSGISARVLCNPMAYAKWYEKAMIKIIQFFGGNTTMAGVYDYIYASRTVIKNRFFNKKVSDGFYGVDVWKYADDVVKPWLSKGMTAYYEIIGYLPNGGYIQKGYDYGCIPPKEGDKYQYGIHFKVLIYRITITNVDGNVHEFSAREVQQWCNNNGLVAVDQYYYGYAGNLYPNIEPGNDWSNNFIQVLANDRSFNMECDSPTCKNKVPHEGVVIKIENMKSEAFKLKCFNFLNMSQKDESTDVEIE